MDEAQFKLEARLAAIEYMVTNMYAFIHRLAQSPPALVWKSHDEAMAKFQDLTLPGMHAVVSDALSAEIQIEVQRMQGAIEEMLGVVRTQKP